MLYAMCCTMMYYDMLSLYYVMLYHDVLYYTITIPWYTMICYTIPWYAITILYYDMMYYHTILSLYYDILYYTMIYHDILWYAMICYHYTMMCHYHVSCLSPRQIHVLHTHQLPTVVAECACPNRPCVLAKGCLFLQFCVKGLSNAKYTDCLRASPSLCSTWWYRPWHGIYSVM